MALTLTQVTDSQDVWGGRYRVRLYDAVPAVSDYATGGYSITPASVGLGTGGKIFGVQCIAQYGGTAWVLPSWNVSTKKLVMAWTAGFTPAGTVAGNVTVKGGGIGEAIGINPDSNAGVLSKAAATDRTIPIATLLGAAPTLTGTAVAAAGLVEVTVGADLSATTFRLLILGA